MILKPDISFCRREEFFDKNPGIGESEREAAGEYLYADFGAGECEVRYALSHSCLIFRYFSEDTGYYFSAPYPLSDTCDTDAAYADIAEYCRLEEIHRVIIDVLPEELDACIGNAKKYDASELDDGTYLVRFYTECTELAELPEIMEGDIYLCEPVGAYADSYSRLINDRDHNRFYGYDAYEDLQTADGAAYVEQIRSEFDRRVSISYAATVMGEGGENIFVGEGTLYGFGGDGTARAAFRVLPEYTRRGYGRAIFRALCAAAKSIGVDRIVCEVMAENLPSLSLLDGLGYSRCRVGDIEVYTIKL